MKRLTTLMFMVYAAAAVFAPRLAGLENQIVLGGEEGWNRIAFTQGIRFDQGKGDRQALMLDHAQYSAQAPDTDLLLHFNRTPIRDAGGRYTVQSGYSTQVADFARLGEGSGSFSDMEKGLTLEAGPDALFSSTPWGDFSVEFWLSPLRMENGESLLYWEGQRIAREEVRLQHLECSISSRRLQWNFENFFLQPGGGTADMHISGRTALVPERWHHHLLRYDARSGVLEYLVDGIPEAVRYVTDTGEESGSVLLPYPGGRESGPLLVGPSFSGFIDELRISSSAVEHPQLTRFPASRGVVETEIIDLKEARSTIQGIDVDYRSPAESELHCFYRTADSYESFLSSPPEWKRFVPGRRLDNSVRTRFIQLRFELYTDGAAEQSPVISRAVLRYEPNPPPGPPAQVEALPRDGSVVVRWSRVENPDLAGYLLYYGPASGNYRGSGAAEGVSPIVIGTDEEVRLRNLDNGSLYYFAVASYDKAGPDHHGPLSAEAHARPSRIYGDED